MVGVTCFLYPLLADNEASADGFYVRYEHSSRRNQTTYIGKIAFSGALSAGSDSLRVVVVGHIWSFGPPVHRQTSAKGMYLFEIAPPTEMCCSITRQISEANCVAVQ